MKKNEIIIGSYWAYLEDVKPGLSSFWALGKITYSEGFHDKEKNHKTYKTVKNGFIIDKNDDSELFLFYETNWNITIEIHNYWMPQHMKLKAINYNDYWAKLNE